MTRSARLLAAVIARARSASAAPLPLATVSAAATSAALPPLFASSAANLPLLLADASRREPALPTSLDWARFYAKGARGAGGGGGGKKAGGGGGKKAGGNKRGRAASSDEEQEDGGDDDDDDDEGDDADDGAGAGADEDPVKLDEIEGMMKAAIEHYSHELAGVRTGRANPGLIENLQVPTESAPQAPPGSGGGSGGHNQQHQQAHRHGHANVPLRALGTVTVRDPQTLAVSVYDPAMAPAVARAIQNSPLGLSATAGAGADAVAGGGGKKNQQSSEVLVRLPRMTREVIDRMVKLVHVEGEGALVSIRRARQKAMDAAKRAYGGGKSSGGNKSGELQRAEKAVAALLEKYTGEVERMKKLKDKELREHRD